MIREFFIILFGVVGIVGVVIFTANEIIGLYFDHKRKHYKELANDFSKTLGVINKLLGESRKEQGSE